MNQIVYFMFILQKKWRETVENSWDGTVSTIVTLIALWHDVTGYGCCQELFNSNSTNGCKPKPLTLTRTPNLVERHLTGRHVGVPVSKFLHRLVIWWAINDTLKMCVDSCLPRHVTADQFEMVYSISKFVLETMLYG